MLSAACPSRFAATAAVTATPTATSARTATAVRILVRTPRSTNSDHGLREAVEVGVELWSGMVLPLGSALGARQGVSGGMEVVVRRRRRGRRPGPAAAG